ncbi:hypothetical protein [Salinarimonas sp.]|uniref:hypothetical protein n=1 Tax=Salinarimonas sp. TaxID=2766526 RepID=UPI00391CD7D3
MAWTLEKTHPTAAQKPRKSQKLVQAKPQKATQAKSQKPTQEKSQRSTQAAGGSSTPLSGNEGLIKALFAATAMAAPFDANERAYPREAKDFVAELVKDPKAARAYLQSLGNFDEQGKLRPEHDQE